jgi:hypothetical protein
MKVVVRSSTQSCKDHVVDCDASWPVSKLKEYLQKNHILHPAVEHQKLIYRGRYILNHETVQALFDPSSPTTIVHLVLAQAYDSLKKNSSQSSTSDITSADNTDTANEESVQTPTSTPTVRKRNVTSTTPDQSRP